MQFFQIFMHFNIQYYEITFDNSTPISLINNQETYLIFKILIENKFYHQQQIVSIIYLVVTLSRKCQPDRNLSHHSLSAILSNKNGVSLRSGQFNLKLSHTSAFHGNNHLLREATEFFFFTSSVGTHNFKKMCT